MVQKFTIKNNFLHQYYTAFDYSERFKFYCLEFVNLNLEKLFRTKNISIKIEYG